MDEQRLYWIDAIRSFACICVITTHAPIPSSGDGEWIIAISNYFSVCGASILFFMISGALVLFKERQFVPFIKTRLSRIAIPMLIWSIVSLLISFCQNEISSKEMIESICMIPFVPQVGTYWFIYVVFGIYLLTPFISSWLSHASKKDVEFYLVIWSLTLLLPYVKLTFPQMEAMTKMHSGYLFPFNGYLGFAILGFYLRKWCNIQNLKKWHILVVIALIVLPAFLYKCPSIPHNVIQNRLSINVAALSVCYFLIIKHLRFSDRVNRFLYDFAQHSFGIYLIQMIIMRRILWPILAPLSIHYAFQIPLIVVLTASISYLVVHLISKFPFSKYIVGL